MREAAGRFVSSNDKREKAKNKVNPNGIEKGESDSRLGHTLDSEANGEGGVGGGGGELDTNRFIHPINLIVGVAIPKDSKESLITKHKGTKSRMCRRSAMLH